MDEEENVISNFCFCYTCQRLLLVPESIAHGMASIEKNPKKQMRLKLNTRDQVFLALSYYRISQMMSKIPSSNHVIS